MLAVILILALFLRFYHLDKSSIWQDEAMTWWWINHNWNELYEILLLDGGNLPLQYIILKYLRGVLGESEFGLRIFSS